MVLINDLEFSDIYLESGLSRFKKPHSNEPYPLPDEYHDDAKNLFAFCQAEEQKGGFPQNFSILYHEHRYRVARMPSITGVVYVLRRNPQAIPELQSLGIPNAYLQNLMRPGLTGGVIVCGPTHSGKTWTVSSLVRQRLMSYGGVAVTAEEPPEMPLHGEHGKGRCYQTAVNLKDGGYASSIRNMMRWNPDMMYLGEILDGETASEFLNASINGHLLFATVHSDTVETLFYRLSGMARKVVGEGSNQLLADGIAAVLHQRLIEGKLECKLLMVDEVGTKKKIRDGEFNNLSAELERMAGRVDRG